MIKSGERIKLLLRFLKTSPILFSRSLGYKRPDTIYNVLNNKYGISSDLVNKIISKYPEINPQWLLAGEGEMIRDKNKVDKKMLDDFNQLLHKESVPYITQQSQIEILKKENEHFKKTIEEQKEEIRFLRDMLKQAKK